MPSQKYKAGIYIHLPFCTTKCMYCDFYSITDSEDMIEVFVNSLVNEISYFKEKKYSYNWEFDTIFFGGGTPSLISPFYINRILNELDKNYNISNVNEITMEINPGETNKENLISYKSLGINRISIGCQSFSDKLLKFLGRLHSKDDAILCYDLVRKIGYDNVNIDMIYDIPGQTIDKWVNDLNMAIGLDPDHICAYSLTVEKGTKLYNLVNDKRIVMPDESIDIEMFSKGIEQLNSAQYKMYEISNYAKKNRKCNHNLHYWENEPYLGFGPSAHSHDLQQRWSNYRSLSTYINEIRNKRLPITQTETLSKNNKFNEIVFNGLRMANGINLDKLNSVNNMIIEDFINKALKKWPQLILDKNHLKLDHSGIIIADEIASDLLVI